jgi:anti-sigma factor RsiW
VRHLGERISALVDGELDHDARDRALAHLSRCELCRAAVAEERWVKARLKQLPATEPSAALLTSLFAAVPASPLGFEPASLGAVSHLRPSFIVAGAGSISAAMFALAYLLGGAVPASQPAAPAVIPPVGQFSAQFAGTTEGLPFSDPAVGVSPAAAQVTTRPAGTR